MKTGWVRGWNHGGIRPGSVFIDPVPDLKPTQDLCVVPETNIKLKKKKTDPVLDPSLK